MGISGLLPLLKSIHKPCNLQKFAGQTIGVDAYGWLHRGTVACAIEIALGKPTNKFVEFSMNRVRMLIHFGVIPYMVFDGDYLPSKAATEGERAKKRDESRKLGLELHRIGKPSQAHLELQKAVDVTPEMARQLIEELKKLGVQYVVAPYEADAQLAYLERKGMIQGIISEDSDLLVFGAKCLLTKLDQYGDCVEINRNDFTACREISLVGWTDAEFRQMAILSGCDYLTNIKKMGLKTAYRHVRKYKTIEKILRMLQFDGQYTVPTRYLEAFKKAELTFLHQRVFCPLVNDIVMNTDLDTEDEPEDFAFIGKAIDQALALGVAKGDLHPMTKEPIVVVGNAGGLPRTPWGRSLKKSLSTPSNLESNKSIKTFFKAQRTPLAELDPNSFTPSPSQQQVMQRANGPWQSSLARAPPTLPRSSASMPPLAAPSHAGSSHTISRGSSFSAPHAQKRRRLCAELEEMVQLPKPLAKAEMQRSRFFTPSAPDPSPSLRRNMKSQGEYQRIDIWSDDSVEDVMAELPDISDRPVLGNTTKLKIFKDKETEPNMDPSHALHQSKRSACEDSQLSTASINSKNTTTTAATSVTVSTLSTTKNFDDPAPSKSTALSERASFQLLVKKCPQKRDGDIHKVKPSEYQKLVRQGSSLGKSARSVSGSAAIIRDDQEMDKLVALDQKVSIQPLPEHRPPQRNAIEHKVNPGEYQNLLYNKVKPPLQRHGSMTPLQRLGVGALKRTQSCIASLGPSGNVMDKTTELGTQKASKGVLLQIPAVVKVPRDASLELLSAKGSEDAMIPNSEEDPEEMSDSGELERPALILGRFAFSG